MDGAGRAVLGFLGGWGNLPRSQASGCWCRGRAAALPDIPHQHIDRGATHSLDGRIVTPPPNLSIFKLPRGPGG